MTITQDGVKHIERRLQCKQVLHIQAGTINLDTMEGLAEVVEVAYGKGNPRLEQVDELFGLFQTFDNEVYII